MSLPRQSDVACMCSEQQADVFRRCRGGFQSHATMITTSSSTTADGNAQAIEQLMQLLT